MIQQMCIKYVLHAVLRNMDGKKRERLERWRNKTSAVGISVKGDPIDDRNNMNPVQTSEFDDPVVAKKKLRLMKFKQKLANGSEEAPKTEEAIDLDAYCDNLTEIAKQDIEASLLKQNKEDNMKAKGFSLVDDDTPVEEDLTSDGKKCYICKEKGHSKSECPRKPCFTCRLPGHTQENCPVQLEMDKKRKMEKWKAKKKEKRQADAENKLRVESGVDNYQNLYQLLRLPTFKVATRSELSKAFQNMSLTWHPDKWYNKPESHQIIAREKYQEVRRAYDILVEGLERSWNDIPIR